jgi:hypothetical protein
MKKRISTSEKFDWLDALMADHRIDARAKVVAFCIMQHLNRGTGLAFVSDPTISDKTGIPKTWVLRARNALRAAGWIIWKRTGTANVYSTLTEPMAMVAEHQQKLKKARQDRRGDAPRVTHRDPPPVAELSKDDQPPMAHHDQPQVGERDPPQVANIPLSLTPVVITPSKKSLEMINQPTSEFETFWRAFPKKVGRLKAEKIYTTIVKAKNATPEELLAGAMRYAAERAGQDPQYTRHPTTWLNAGGWLDEPQPSRPKANESIMAGLLGYCEEQ